MAENKNNKFEDNLAELTALVQKLESDLPLDQAIAAFEKGIALTKVCLEELKAEWTSLTDGWSQSSFTDPEDYIEAMSEAFEREYERLLGRG